MNYSIVGRCYMVLFKYLLHAAIIRLRSVKKIGKVQLRSAPLTDQVLSVTQFLPQFISEGGFQRRKTSISQWNKVNILKFPRISDCLQQSPKIFQNFKKSYRFSQHLFESPRIWKII